MAARPAHTRTGPKASVIDVRRTGVLSQNPDVLVMQPIQNRDGCDGAALLRAPKIRRILVQQEMRPNLVVIGSVGPDAASGRFEGGTVSNGLNPVTRVASGTLNLTA